MSLYKTQIIKDTTADVTIKFTGYMEGANTPQNDGANTTLIVSMLKGAYDTNGALRSVTGNNALPFYGVWIDKIQYNVGSLTANGSVALNWRGSTSNSVAIYLPVGQETIELNEGWGQIKWDAVGTGANTGELFVSANGVSFGSYTIIVHARKDPVHFDRGRLVDTAYFQNP